MPEREPKQAGDPDHGVSGKPWWCYPLLAVAVVAAASSGTIFKSFDDVQSATLASWRLQAVFVIILPGLVYQLVKTLSPEERRLYVRQSPYLLYSGLALGLHFYAWVWAVKHTSLTHALLFVCLNPVLLAFGALLIGSPISKGELCGSVVGTLGGMLLALDVESDQEVTAAGDAMALLACACFVAYLSIGRSLRDWMPLWAYFVPVTAVAAAFLALWGVVAEGSHAFGLGPSGTLGWLGWRYLPRILLLALLPGILGHAGFNLLLAYLHPLAISLPLAFNPVLGSVVGWAFGYAAVPGWLTWVGGAVVVASTVWVLAAGHERERGASGAAAERGERGERGARVAKAKVSGSGGGDPPPGGEVGVGVLYHRAPGEREGPSGRLGEREGEGERMGEREGVQLQV